MGKPGGTIPCDQSAQEELVTEGNQRRYQKSFDTPLVYASDEYYLAAGRPVPSGRHYGDYAQFENGVGMVRWLIEDWPAPGRQERSEVTVEGR